MRPCDDGDPLRQAVGLLEILRRQITVVWSRRSSSTMLHSSWRVCGSSPVVGSSRKSTGGRPAQACAKVEPATHAAGVGRYAAVGSFGKAEALEQLTGASPRLNARKAV